MQPCVQQLLKLYHSNYASTFPLLRESHFARLNSSVQISIQGEEGLVGVVHEEERVLHRRRIKALLSQQVLLPFERACEEGEIAVPLMYVLLTLIWLFLCLPSSTWAAANMTRHCVADT